MKHNYYVKHNGVLYAPGTDVPGSNTPVKAFEPKKEESNTDKPLYTRNQIQRMNGGNLQKLAAELGLSFDGTIKDRELKTMIFAKLGI